MLVFAIWKGREGGNVRENGRGLVRRTGREWKRAYKGAFEVYGCKSSIAISWLSYRPSWFFLSVLLYVPKFFLTHFLGTNNHKDKKLKTPEKILWCHIIVLLASFQNCYFPGFLYAPFFCLTLCLLFQNNIQNLDCFFCTKALWVYLLYGLFNLFIIPANISPWKWYLPSIAPYCKLRYRY